jgi:hypothetical protein
VLVLLGVWIMDMDDMEVFISETEACEITKRAPNKKRSQVVDMCRVSRKIKTDGFEVFFKSIKSNVPEELKKDENCTCR